MSLRTSEASATTSYPQTFTEPEVGRSNVDIILSAVVFPAPLGPMSPKISPGLIARLKPSKARIFPKTLVKSTVSTAELKTQFTYQVDRFHKAFKTNARVNPEFSKCGLILHKSDNALA